MSLAMITRHNFDRSNKIENIVQNKDKARQDAWPALSLYSL